jgi:hypothetical protein
MSDTYIIEVASQAAGIVVRSRGGYVFFAATHRFNPMEGQLFRNAREAERAARRLVNGDLSLVAQRPRHDGARTGRDDARTGRANVRPLAGFAAR